MLCENCPNMELFLVLISCIRTEHGPEITPYLDTFHTAYFKLDTISNEY